MDNVFEPLFRFGFHDVKLYGISDSMNTVTLHFNDGIYTLDASGNEIGLTNAAQVRIQIELPPHVYGVDQVFDIETYYHWSKIKDYFSLKNHIEKSPMEIFMVYFSPFDNTLLLRGTTERRRSIDFSIECIKNIEIVEAN